MTYKAIDIAKYIVTYCAKRADAVSNLKLQKMLYFVWVDYYKKTNEWLFKDSLFAWFLGPVVPDVYYEFCCFAGNPIDRIYDTNIDNDDINILNPIIDDYIPLTARALVSKSHEEGKPWKKIYGNGEGNKQEIPFPLIISMECMQSAVY